MHLNGGLSDEELDDKVDAHYLVPELYLSGDQLEQFRIA